MDNEWTQTDEPKDKEFDDNAQGPYISKMV